MFTQRALAKLGLLCPSILMQRPFRNKLKCLAHAIPYWERDYFNTQKAVEPWAFLRVHNELKMIQKSLPNIAQVIHKGVIATHGSTDGTDEYVKDFCKKNKGFIFYQYPYPVIPAHDKRYQQSVPYENTLAAYYNAVLELIPKNEWLIKIDADMICFPNLLERTFHMMQSDTDCISYSRLNLVRTSSNQWKIFSYQRPGDHWLIKNNNLKFINKSFLSKDGFRAYEILLKNRVRTISPECVWLHFPYEKEWRNNYQNFHLSLYDIDTFLNSIPAWEIDKNYFNKENILSIANSIPN